MQTQKNTTPLKLYKERTSAGTLQADAEQEKAVHALDRLHDALLQKYAQQERSFIKKLISAVQGGSGAQKIDLRGVYMYGGVGRGKSMLMDLFYECLPREIKKRRIHFHEFMIEVHDYFHSRRSADDISEGVDALIPSLSTILSARAQVLCFDEFHVTDVADAMILGRLFTALFDRGMVIVATSNWSPERLYEGGLQRDRFLPFIDLLKRRMEVVHLDSDTDYRAKFLQDGGTYFHPLGAAARDWADDVFAKLVQGKEAHRAILNVKGRNIVVSRAVDGVARFSFAQLCENPHGAEDYLKIAQTYHTVFLENIPLLGYDRRNEAKRLMTLIDALYDTGTKLVVTADAPADEIYRGHDHGFEFTRTVSRLLEMQSKDYLGR